MNKIASTSHETKQSPVRLADKVKSLGTRVIGLYGNNETNKAGNFEDDLFKQEQQEQLFRKISYESTEKFIASTLTVATLMSEGTKIKTSSAEKPDERDFVDIDSLEHRGMKAFIYEGILESLLDGSSLRIPSPYRRSDESGDFELVFKDEGTERKESTEPFDEVVGDNYEFIKFVPLFKLDAQGRYNPEKTPEDIGISQDRFLAAVSVLAGLCVKMHDSGILGEDTPSSSSYLSQLYTGSGFVSLLRHTGWAEYHGLSEQLNVFHANRQVADQILGIFREPNFFDDAMAKLEPKPSTQVN